MDGFELEKFVDYVFKTPSGGILHLKNDAAIIIRGNNAEILSSLEDYHAKYKDDTSTWNELTTDQDKKKLYDANAAALKKIRWAEVEAAVEAAQKLEGAEKRKSLIDWFVGGWNDLLNAIVSFPLVILAIWGISFGVERYFGVELSHFKTSGIAVLGTICVSKLVPEKPGRGTFMMAAIGYLLLVLTVWIYG